VREVVVSARLASALGVGDRTRGEEVRVDDVDRRYRDAIKAGATPVEPPFTDGLTRRAALRDTPSGSLVRLISDIQP